MTDVPFALARPIPEGMAIFLLIHGVNKIEDFGWSYFCSIIISREQFSIYTIMFLIIRTRCKKYVIPLIVGLRYIFYPRSIEYITIDRANQWDLNLCCSDRFLSRVARWLVVFLSDFFCNVCFVEFSSLIVGLEESVITPDM